MQRWEYTRPIKGQRGSYHAVTRLSAADEAQIIAGQGEREQG